MQIKTYTRVPVNIEAVQVGNDYDEDCEIIRWCEGILPLEGDISSAVFYINTLEGVMAVLPGDYVIKGTAGEFYPCKPEIFENIYREAV